MPSTIIISDVHGSTHWQTFVRLACEGDSVIFLGDYFDLRGRGPFADSQVENFQNICAWARSHPKTFLLTGNHDFYYLFSTGAWNSSDGGNFRRVMLENVALLDMVFIDDHFPKPAIFSHGGLTNTFLKNHGLNSPFEVNTLWHSDPSQFDWLECDPCTGQISVGNGDDIWQPPTWARTEALFMDGIFGYDQVVGHTPVKRPVKFLTYNNDLVLLTCTLDDQCIVLNQSLSLNQNLAALPFLTF